MDKKICSRCKEEKNLEEFGKDKSRPSGYSYWCKPCVKKNIKKWEENNKDRVEEYKKNYERERYNENKEFFKEKTILWRKNNPDKTKQYSKKSYERNKNNINFKINISMSTGIYKSIKEKKNKLHWENLVDYTLEELMQHLEKQFKDGMTWDNYGSYWHIDHIKPKSWFLFESTEDEAFKKCWGLDNLQPLEASKNCSKRDRYEG